MNAVDRHQLAALMDEANIKSRIKRDIRFVPEEITDWQDRDFIAVMNRSRTEGVLIAPLEKTYVVPFQLQTRRPNVKGRTEAIICDFCASWQRGSNSAIISFPRREGSIVSFMCCGDLLCSLHVRDKTTASKLSRTQLRETNTMQDRILRLQRNLSTKLQSFARSPGS